MEWVNSGGRRWWEAEVPSIAALEAVESLSNQAIPYQEFGLFPKVTVAMSSQSPAPNMEGWKVSVTRRIFNVTLEEEEAEKSAWTLVYLKDLAAELRQEGQGEIRPR